MLESRVPWYFRSLLWLVGGEILSDSGHPQLLREKCRSSLTSVGLVFVLNVGILSVLLGAYLGLPAGATTARWTTLEVLSGLGALALALVLCGATDGFRRRLKLTLVALLLPLLHHLSSWPVSAALGISASSVLFFSAVAVLFMSSFMLVVSLEFYDSGINPDLPGRSIRNLEYNGSRFYFCGLWLTVLSVVLIIASRAWHLGLAAILTWCLAIAFVVKFEQAMEV